MPDRETAENDRTYPDTLAGDWERLRDACRDFVRAIPWIGPRVFPPGGDHA